MFLARFSRVVVSNGCCADLDGDAGSDVGAQLPEALWEDLAEVGLIARGIVIDETERLDSVSGPASVGGQFICGLLVVPVCPQHALHARGRGFEVVSAGEVTSQQGERFVRVLFKPEPFGFGPLGVERFGERTAVQFEGLLERDRPLA